MRLPYCISDRLLYFGLTRTTRRRLPAWLILGTICLWNLGFCTAQKDAGLEGKTNSNPSQNSRKVSEDGESKHKVINNLAGHARATVHTAQQQGEGGGQSSGETGNGPPVIVPGRSNNGNHEGNAETSPENAGSPGNGNSENGNPEGVGSLGRQEGQHPLPSPIHPSIERPLPGDNGNGPQSGTSQSGNENARGGLPSNSRPRNGDEGTGSNPVNTFGGGDSPTGTGAQPGVHPGGGLRKSPKGRPETGPGGSSSENNGGPPIQTDSGTLGRGRVPVQPGDSSIQNGGGSPIGGGSSTQNGGGSPIGGGSSTQNGGGSPIGGGSSTQNGDGSPIGGGSPTQNGGSPIQNGGSSPSQPGGSPIELGGPPIRPDGSPVQPGGSSSGQNGGGGSSSEIGGGGREGSESKNHRGQLGEGSEPRSPTRNGQGEVPLRPNQAPGQSPQLVPRSGGPLPVLPHATEPLESATNSTGQDGESEDPASNELIKAVNDEYVDVVKNLTDAGILTESDYESKPVSDLFAILLEKLINANPGAGDEEQRRLVHQAGIEFVEVFKANAAVTKNVTEIVRLVNEQLQQPGIGQLNEGRSDGLNPTESSNSFNPFESGASAGRIGINQGGQHGDAALTNSSLSANQSVSGPSRFGANRRPNGGEIPRLPGPPGSGIIDSSLETTSPKNGQHPAFGLPGAGGDTDSTTAPRIGFGQNGPLPPQFGIGGASVGQGNNGTGLSENGTVPQGSAIDPSGIIPEASESPGGIPPVSPRYPFPARIPTTLRPPLRFFTTTSSTTSLTDADGQPRLGGGGLGVITQSPLGITGSSPAFIPFSQSPSDGKVIIGNSPVGANESSEAAVGAGDFPTPPTWEFGSEATPGPVIIGGGGRISGSDVSEEPIKLVTVQPGSAEAVDPFGLASNSSGPPNHGINVFDGQSQSPFIATSPGEILAPFTHDVNGPIGGPAGSTELPGLIGGNGGVGETKSNGSSGDEWLVFGSGSGSGGESGGGSGGGLLVDATPGPFEENTTLGESFITESANASNLTPSPVIPFGFPGAEPGLESGIGSNNTNGTSGFIPAEGSGLDPFAITAHPGLEVPFGQAVITVSNQPEEGNETSQVTISPDEVMIGHEDTMGPGVSGILVSTESAGFPVGAEAVTSLPGESNETVVGINGQEGVPPGLEGFSSMAPEPGHEMEGHINMTTLGSGSAVEVTLPTIPEVQHGTQPPDLLETTTSSGVVITSSGPGSNAVLTWSFRMPDASWDPDLLNKETETYQKLQSELALDLQTLFKTLEPKRFVAVLIKRFSKGSVIVDGQTELTEHVDSASLLESFVKLVAEHKNMVGGKVIDPSSITFDRIQNAPQAGSSNASASSAGTSTWIIGVVVAVVVVALVAIALVVIIKRRKRQTGRDNYMVDEETMNGGPKPWPPNHARPGQHQAAQLQQHSSRGAGLSNGREQYPGVNMYEMKEPSAPQNAHLNYGYQPDRAANGIGGHGRSVTEIHINAETDVDNEASSKH